MEICVNEVLGSRKPLEMLQTSSIDAKEDARQLSQLMSLSPTLWIFVVFCS